MPFRTLVYVPEKNEFYSLPEMVGFEPEIPLAFSCRGNLFLVSREIHRAQCFYPELNCWSPAPWTKTDSCLELLPDGHWLIAVLVVENQIYFFSEHEGIPEKPTWFSKYDLDANSIVPSMHLLDKTDVCFVAVNKQIYTIGGCKVNNFREIIEFLKECKRFEPGASEWQGIANLQEPRRGAYGVGTHDKIFIPGGTGSDMRGLQGCEMYSVETDEWHFMGSLTSNHVCFGNMMLVDGYLYVLCGDWYYEDHERTVEHYNHEEDE